MKSDDLEKAVNDLRKDIVSVEKCAASISLELPVHCLALESLKVDILKYKLEQERRRIARVQGFTTLRKDKTKLGISLGASVVGMIIAGAFSKDKYYALNTGLRTFDASLQEFGNSRWAVTLDENMLVMPQNHIFSGRLWVTWESLDEALDELKMMIQNKAQLGDIGSIISALKQASGKLKYLKI